LPDLSQSKWFGTDGGEFYVTVLSSDPTETEDENDKTTPTYYLAICAIAKNEGPYFKEWIEWHKKLGVEKFYIYDNESVDHTKQVLESYIDSGLVEYIYFPGKRQQLLAYDDCLEKHRTDSHWIAFIDLDEFIVPLKDSSIPEFLRKFESHAAVEINWLIYGSGGAKEKTEGNVMDRFKYHSRPDHILNRHVKASSILVEFLVSSVATK